MVKIIKINEKNLFEFQNVIVKIIRLKMHPNDYKQACLVTVW